MKKFYALLIGLTLLILIVIKLSGITGMVSLQEEKTERQMYLAELGIVEVEKGVIVNINQNNYANSNIISKII